MSMRELSSRLKQWRCERADEWTMDTFISLALALEHKSETQSDEIDRLRAELAKRDENYLELAGKYADATQIIVDLRADLEDMEKSARLLAVERAEFRIERDKARRLIDEARGQVPKVFVCHKTGTGYQTVVRSQTMAQQYRKEGYSVVGYYADPVPAQTAAVPMNASDITHCANCGRPLTFSSPGNGSCYPMCSRPTVVFTPVPMNRHTWTLAGDNHPSAVPEAVAKEVTDSDAPMYYGRDEASAWANGYNAALAAILSATDTETTPEVIPGTADALRKLSIRNGGENDE